MCVCVCEGNAAVCGGREAPRVPKEFSRRRVCGRIPSHAWPPGLRCAPRPQMGRRNRRQRPHLELTELINTRSHISPLLLPPHTQAVSPLRCVAPRTGAPAPRRSVAPAALPVVAAAAAAVPKKKILILGKRSGEEGGGGRVGRKRGALAQREFFFSRPQRARFHLANLANKQHTHTTGAAALYSNPLSLSPPPPPPLPSSQAAPASSASTWPATSSRPATRSPC